EASGEDLSDEEILQKCEQQLNEMRNTEVNRESGNEINEVIRRKPKRFIRSDSVDVNNGKEKDKEGTYMQIVNHEVCITSVETLPKPIAMAKLLRSENITDILKIKYKSMYKVLIQFQRKDDATKLTECKKFKDMGLRCQLVQDMSTSFGIVKGIDLELSEEELINIFNADVEVLTVKRLKRLQSEGNWIDCESVRVSFKGNALPQYIYAYGCRFNVEPYVFPVTQCSGCWQFGHIIKYCPTKKVLCPKCGGNHENCTIKDFKCLNCKGNHFVLDKTCPVFLKEKTIRIIMSQKQVTYRRALQLFLENKKEFTDDFSQRFDNTPSTAITTTDKESYRDVLTRVVVHQQPVSDMDEDEEEEDNREDKDSAEKEKERSRHRSQWLNNFEWKKIWIKIKGIYNSELKLEEKILSTLKIIWEELKIKSALLHLARCASGCRGASIAYDILKLIYNYNKDGIKIILQWVPAHIGLRGNEEADRLSKLASETGNVTSYLPDYWEYFSMFKKVWFEKWKKYFDDISKEKGIWYK
ncbi:hypothetical protein HW555_012984, partial [Spodoptera exigua]